MAKKETVDEIFSLEEAALATAKEKAIKAAVEKKALAYEVKMQLFISHEIDARKSRSEADKLAAELDITEEEKALLFPTQ